MKHSTHNRKLAHAATSRRAAFTLVELLGVILILSTLFAMILPAVKLSIRTAQKRQAAADATALAQAVLRYRQTYGYWPGIDADEVSGIDPGKSHTFITLHKNKPKDKPERPAWADPEFPGWDDSGGANPKWSLVEIDHADVIKALILSKDNATNLRRIRFLDIPDSRLSDGRFLDPWSTPYVLVIHPPTKEDPEPDDGPLIGGRPVGWSDVVAFSFGPPGRVSRKGESDNLYDRTAANLIFSAGVPR